MMELQFHSAFIYDRTVSAESYTDCNSMTSLYIHQFIFERSVAESSEFNSPCITHAQ